MRIRTKAGSRSVAGSDRVRPLLPGGSSVAVERVPRGESPRVVHAVEEQHAVQVVDLVLERAGSQPRDAAPLRPAGAVLVFDLDLGVTGDYTAQVRHRQAAFVDGQQL